MTKSLFGGSAVVAAALLSGSLIVYSLATAIETPAAPSPKRLSQQARSGASGPSVMIEGELPAPGELPAVVVTNMEEPPPPPPAAEEIAAGPPETYVATAYSLPGRTASGRPVGQGIIAADRRVLPLGTRVRLDAGPHSGVYVVADTGGSIRGRRIDIWMRSSRDARRFGRRPVRLTVLRQRNRRPAARSAARR